MSVVGEMYRDDTGKSYRSVRAVMGDMEWSPPVLGPNVRGGHQ